MAEVDSMGSTEREDEEYMANKAKGRSPEYKPPDFKGFVVTILHDTIFLGLLLCFGAGIVSILRNKGTNTPGTYFNKYIKVDGVDTHISVPGADGDSMPYIYPNCSSDKTSECYNSKIWKITDLFRADKGGWPYNTEAYQKLANAYMSEKDKDMLSNPSSEEATKFNKLKSGFGPVLYVWAIRMIAWSASWVRALLKGFIDICPELKENNWGGMTEAFILLSAWLPFGMLGAGMATPIIPIIFTLCAMINTWKNWGWVGGSYLGCMFNNWLIPGLLYLWGIFFTPGLVFYINSAILPTIYLILLIQIIYYNWSSIKGILADNYQGIAFAFIIIMIMSANKNLHGGYPIGVMIWSGLILFMYIKYRKGAESGESSAK